MSKDKRNKIKEKETMATEIALVIIRKCKQQLLTAWKWKIECSIRYGYEHNIAQLLRKRESKVQRTGNAMEMQVLLRRCSYPKRDVIRWEIDKNEDICPRRVHSFEESLCPGNLKKSLSFRFVVLKASPTSVGKTKDSGIDFFISSFLQL